ncbi:tryptophan synthase, alpha chain [Magnetococcus marinus MC-1]|uniref:Tryptophan synthase alpha chain n=1 Tax=Magnetococcus marinus (strain ATCC BAA-1437 / JCM 17883 / MC-1) TaxID=156889 RepID=A0L4H1_MAGMM|nr:tryptophan synthase subunit alpha [Magnetococcus marinus]ABK42864.1 tryptophan synthase, alpha chain [Magnetococcus marinus MC-1]
MSRKSALEGHIKDKLQQQDILLMSHIVLGYPSLQANREVIRAMVAGGVDLMELQIPFSEPIADGPTIARANQAALDGGFKVREGLAFIREVVAAFNIPFLIMTYTNILMAYGVERFIDEVADIGVKGLIIPDLPLEQAQAAIEQCRAKGMDWIGLMTPTSVDERLGKIGAAADGFVYCVARRGVTGSKTSFDEHVGAFMHRCRQATPVPLAVGFGVRSAEDVDYLKGKAEIAVVGSAALDLFDQAGAAALEPFFRGLRG